MQHYSRQTLQRHEKGGKSVAGELFDQAGNRKYLTADERKSFLKAADRAPREVRTFCHLLHFSGCRISEPLAFTCDRRHHAG